MAGVAFRLTDGKRVVLVAVADRVDELPHECRVTVRASMLDGRCAEEAFRPALLGAAELLDAAERLRAAADGRSAVAGMRIPAEISLAGLRERSGQAPHSSGLDAVFLCGEEPVRLDLVAAGPHAVVGGTTGSGKSELLISWVLSMAIANGPSRLNLLLVDFKGGSSFGHLAELPQCVGVMTDLDTVAATRAITSLRAEMQRREAMLAAAAARDVSEHRDLARLVIVVDEFATMVRDLPELAALFADIAARGRSLGMHLLLCTQRPAQSIKDEILANCGIRISLRTPERLDSLALLGDDAAATLPREPLGRAVVLVAGERALLAQTAIAGTGDIQLAVRAHAGASPPKRPWCAPLARSLAREQPPDRSTIRLGQIDRPAKQRIDHFDWAPLRDGSMLALGMRGSGLSNAARLVAGHARVRLVNDEESLDDLARSAAPGVVAVDDIDVLLERLSDDQAGQLIAALGQRIREGSATRFAMFATARRVTARLQRLAGLIEQTVVFRHERKESWLVAGGSATDFDHRLPNGAAYLRGERVQFAVADRAVVPVQPMVFPVERGPIAVVAEDHTQLPSWLLEQAGAPGSGSLVVLATAAQWEAQFGALERAGQDRTLVFVGQHPSVIRRMLRAAPPPPVCRHGRVLAFHAGQWRRSAFELATADGEA